MYSDPSGYISIGAIAAALTSLYVISSISNMTANSGNNNLRGSLGSAVHKAKKKVEVLTKTIYYLSLIEQTVTYVHEEGWTNLKIPNDTEAAQAFFRFVHINTDVFLELELDWARLMAISAVNKFERETGNTFPLPLDKVTWEIRIHAQLYNAQWFMSNTDITDVSPARMGWYEVWRSQWWVDATYDMGWR